MASSRKRASWMHFVVPKRNSHHDRPQARRLRRFHPAPQRAVRSRPCRRRHPEAALESFAEVLGKLKLGGYPPSHERPPAGHLWRNESGLKEIPDRCFHGFSLKCNIQDLTPESSPESCDLIQDGFLGHGPSSPRSGLIIARDAMPLRRLHSDLKLRMDASGQR